MDLRIQIQHKFKNQIKQRFLYENRVVERDKEFGDFVGWRAYAYIPISCPLCELYKHKLHDCMLCPLGEWMDRNDESSCKNFVGYLLNETPLFKMTPFLVKWWMEDDIYVKRQLERLQDIMEQIIEWV